MTTALQFRSFLLEDAPPAPPAAPPKRCQAADLIRYQMWHSPRVLRFVFLDELRAHIRICPRCLRHNANPTGIVQANPDLAPGEILSGELDNTRRSAPATLPEPPIAELEKA